MSFTHTLTSKSQITIPKQIREVLGLRPGDMATFKIKRNGEVVIEKPRTLQDIRQLLKHPEGAVLTKKEALIIEGMKKSGRQTLPRR